MPRPSHKSRNGYTGKSNPKPKSRYGDDPLAMLFDRNPKLVENIQRGFIEHALQNLMDPEGKPERDRIRREKVMIMDAEYAALREAHISQWATDGAPND